MPTETRIAPSLYKTLTSGGSTFESALTGDNQFKFGVTLSDDVHGLRNESLTGFRNLLQSIRGNQGQLIKARTRPLEEARAAALGNVTRNLGRRNVTGTLANNEITNVERKFGISIGDARAQGTQEQLNAEAAIMDRISGQADRVAEDEFKSLGLGAQAFGNTIQSMGTRTQSGGDLFGLDIGQWGQILDTIGGWL